MSFVGLKDVVIECVIVVIVVCGFVLVVVVGNVGVKLLLLYLVVNFNVIVVSVID